MDRKKLNQYKTLQKEIPKLQKKLDKLYDRRLDIPVVLGKVTKSSDDFPYIEEHLSVQMDEPHEADELSKQIRINEERLSRAERDKTEIEDFIAGITVSIDRQIFEYVFLEGLSQQVTADRVGYSKGRISQKISEYLKH